MAGLKFHQVREGDNLDAIGRRFGVPWQKLAQLNKLPDPNKIKPGEVIMVPSEPSPEDRMRVEGAKQAASYVDERPSQGPRQIDSTGMAFEVDLGPRAPRAAPLPGRAGDVTAPPTFERGGSLESVNAKSYPPNSPEQMLYPEFWMDFLDRALPTATAGASGPGAALMRGGAALRRMDNPFQPEPNAARADFNRRAGRHFERNPNEPADPNYGAYREPRGPEPRPDPREVKDWNWYKRYDTDAKAPRPMPRKGDAPAQPRSRLETIYDSIPSRPPSARPEPSPFKGWGPTNEDVSFVRRLVEHFGGVPAQWVKDATRGDALRGRPMAEHGKNEAPTAESPVTWEDLAMAFRALGRFN